MTRRMGGVRLQRRYSTSSMSGNPALVRATNLTKCFSRGSCDIACSMSRGDKQ